MSYGGHHRRNATLDDADRGGSASFASELQPARVRSRWAGIQVRHAQLALGVAAQWLTRSVGPRLTGIYDTLLRTKRLEGWYGLYKGEAWCR